MYGQRKRWPEPEIGGSAGVLRSVYLRDILSHKQEKEEGADREMPFILCLYTYIHWNYNKKGTRFNLISI